MVCDHREVWKHTYTLFANINTSTRFLPRGHIEGMQGCFYKYCKQSASAVRCGCLPLSVCCVCILSKQSIAVVCWQKRSIPRPLLMGNGTIFTSDPSVITQLVSLTHTCHSPWWASYNLTVSVYTHISVLLTCRCTLIFKWDKKTKIFTALCSSSF